MRLPFSLRGRRAISLAFATAILASSVAGTASAATPAGGIFDAGFSFRDIHGTAVLAVYPFSDGETTIGYLRVKGPRAAWIASHPLLKGSVGWRVIVRTAPTKLGPWTVESITKERTITADTTGAMEQFKNRTVEFQDTSDRLFVRVTSRLIWHNEDGGKIGQVQHTYTAYGLTLSTGLLPSFGDESETRTGMAPNIWVP